MEIFMMGGDNVDEWVSFFRTLNGVSPLFEPVRMGNNEPLRIPYSMANLYKCWKWPFFWQGQKGARGAIFLPAGGSKLVRYSMEAKGSENALHLASKAFYELVRSPNCLLGFCHCLRSEEIDVGRQAGYVFGTSSSYFDISAKIVRRYLPGLFDLNFFGKDYLGLLPMTEWKELPGVSMEVLRNGGKLVALNTYPDGAYGELKKKRALLLQRAANGVFYSPKSNRSSVDLSPLAKV